MGHIAFFDDLAERGRIDLAHDHVLATGGEADARPSAAADVEQRHCDEVHRVGREEEPAAEPVHRGEEVVLVSITPLGRPVVPDE